MRSGNDSYGVMKTVFKVKKIRKAYDYQNFFNYSLNRKKLLICSYND